MPQRRIQTIKERIQSESPFILMLKRCTAVVDDCVRLATTDRLQNATLEFCICRLEHVERSLHRASGSLLNQDDAQQLLQTVQELLCEFRKGNADNDTTSGYQAPRTEASAGAPRYAITRQQLQFLIECGFTKSRMGQLLGVSKSTISRRLRKLRLKARGDFSSMTSNKLDEEIKECISHNNHLGPNSVKARLLAKKITVQRWRVRESMLRIDPGGAAFRTALAVRRRTYRVAGPNSLWHVDGNHKLIRWRIVIHGSIDGFSRLMVFLRASTNNRKETVLEQFLKAVGVYGLPSRVRVDHGGENNAICEIMDVLRGTERASSIRGKSVHNQRIERFWLDLWNGAVNVYWDLFHFLENYGCLDVDNEAHLWALHYIFIPRLNQELELVRASWNRHGLRTEGHQTPLQLFVGHSLMLFGTQLTAVKEMFKSSPEIEERTKEIQARAGQLLDWEDSSSQEQPISVPDVPCPLSEQSRERLYKAVNPLGCSTDLGMDLYMQVLKFIADNS